MFRTCIRFALPMLALVVAAVAPAAEVAAVAERSAAATTASQAKQPGTDKAARKPAARVAHVEAALERDVKPAGDVQMSGMSVLGNDDSPKALVIVPWKSSQLGDMPGLSRVLDDSTQPVDKEVFMRELAYYQIKVESK
jgi:hypothetical protein